MNRTLFLLLVSNAVASVGTGIAMIAVPWLLAQGDDGAVLFSRIATVVNVGLFLITPFIGPVIDSRPRKQLMILLRLGFVAGLAGILVASQIFQTLAESWLLAAYYILGATFYVVNIPLRSAFVKDLFEEGNYAQVNAILEVENQVAAVVTGLLAILVIDLFGLSRLVLINVLCLGLAIVSLMYIRQGSRSHNKIRNEAGTSLFEGVQLLLARPKLMVLILAASVPYVVVILYTVIHPVALALLPDQSCRLRS
jgi:MFS family permease